MSTTSLSSAEVDEKNIIVRYFVDRGGTFTDCVAQMSDGTQRKHKVLSDSRYLFSGTLTGSSFRFNEEYQTPAIANFFQGYRARFLKLASSIEAPPTITITSSDQSGVYWPSSIVGIKSHEPCFCIVELQSDEPSPVVGLRWIANLARHENLPNCEVIVATTIATNALLEGTIAKTALITTKGFEDLLVIGDQTRLDLFAIDVQKTQPMADKSFGVVERIDASGGIVLPLDLTSAKKALDDARTAGCNAVAIALMNSYRNPTHEITIANLANEFGFQQVSLSSNISPTQSLLARAETTVLDSCLTPVVQSWLTTLRSRFPGPIYVVTSSGTKTPSDEFLGRDSLYSGPAGGALALHSVYSGRPLIGFDMGGTSTDISRYEDSGDVSLRYETMFNGPTGGRYRIVAPMIDIETIAAGGGSICWFDGTELRVGPASAGSHPGPACYGRGGPFTITDANVILGRIPLAIFPLPLDRDAAKSALDSIIIRIRDFTGVHYKHEDLASDFLKIANLSMAHAIRNVTIEKGKKPESHSLVAFGGAAPQHVCALADTLGIDEVIIHPLASYFSAFGLAFADQRSFHQLATAQLLSESLLHRICECANKYATQLTVVETTLDLTYDGQSNNLQITCDTSKLIYQEIVSQFAAKHESIFGFKLDRRLYLNVATLIVKTKSARPQQRSFPTPSSTNKHLAVIGKQSSWDADTSTWREISILSTVESPPSSQTDIPAHSDSPHNFLEPYILQINGSSIWVAKGFVVNIDDSGTLYLKRPPGSQTLSVDASALIAYKNQNPTPLEVTLLQKHLTQIADEMGAMLRRTALSINIKDRLDYSCAVFTPDGDLIVNAPIFQCT